MMSYTPNNNPYIAGDPYSYDLKWIVEKLKEAIDLYTPLRDEFEAVKVDFDDLKNYVNDYFNNLDLTAEVQTIIDQMRIDGFFDQLISEIVTSSGTIESTTAEWLATNVTPVGSAVVVDASLSISGAAADAAVTRQNDYLLSNTNIDSTNLVKGTWLNGAPDAFNSDSRLCTARWLSFPFDIIITFGGLRRYVGIDGGNTYSWNNTPVSIPAYSKFFFTACIDENLNDPISKDELCNYISVRHLKHDISDIKPIADDPNLVNNINWQRGTALNSNILWLSYRLNAASRICALIHAHEDLVIYGHVKYFITAIDNENQQINSGWISDTPYKISAGMDFGLTATLDNTVNDPVSTEDIIKGLFIYNTKPKSIINNSLISYSRLGYLSDNANTPPAQSKYGFLASYLHGYSIILADCEFTSDHVPVCVHDATINAEARNIDGSAISGAIRVIDYPVSILDNYDWGLVKGLAWKGLKTPRISDFIMLAKTIGFHPIIEIRPGNLTDDNADALASIIKNNGMDGKITFYVETEQVITQLKARLSAFNAFIIVASTQTDTYINNRINNMAIMGDENYKLGVIYYTATPTTSIISNDVITNAQDKNIPIWFTEATSEEMGLTVLANNPYISGMAIRPKPISGAI